VARLFVAAWPPPAVVEALAALARPERDGVRWTAADQWHVTLRFFGEVSPAVAYAALDELTAAPAVAAIGPRVGRFGRGLLAIPVGGLDELAAAVVRATDGVGRPPEPRRFRGHVTLARLRDRARVTGLTGARLDERFDVREVALVHSEPHPDGSRYHTIATFALKPGAGV
jgi:RNA 2',3'-cyclic 3'-phosphodiesterase